jgi:hypothetical protein
VNDGTTTGYVKSGVADGVTIKKETPVAAGTKALDDNGQATVTASTTFEVHPDLFSSAGIYRYQITDTSATGTNVTALEGAGVVQGSATDKEYFLDVYLSNDDTNPGKLKVSGYVLSAKNNEEIKPGTDEPAAEKKPGFGTDPTSSSDPYPVDKNYTYPTYNVILNKKVEGSMGDKQNGFPFTVTVTNNDLGYDYEVTGSTNPANNVDLKSQTPVTSVNLGDGSTLKIWGLSPFATVNYSEKNNLPETYQTKVGNTAGAADVQGKAALAQNAEKAAFDSVKAVATGYAINTKATVNPDADAIYFTNTLDDVSQTGVVLRFAPYAIMLGAGVALFIILKVRKNKAVEEA